MKKLPILLTVAAMFAAAAVATVRAQQASPASTNQARQSSSLSAAQIESAKRDLAAEVESMRTMTQQMVDQVFSFGELGYQEFETAKYLTGILKKNGFTIQTNVAGMPTGWTATWGSGKPVIALGSDIDDIPAGVAKTGCGISRSDRRGSTGSWRRTQLRVAASDHGSPGSEKDNGAR